MIVNASTNRFVFHRHISYAEFAAASLDNSIVLFRGPPRNILRNVKIKHNIPFAGGSITAYTVSVGTMADLELFASRYDVFQVVSPETFQLSVGIGAASEDDFWDVYITAHSIGDNLDQATVGELYVTCEMLIL